MRFLGQQGGGQVQEQQYEDEGSIPQATMYPGMPRQLQADNKWQYELQDVLQNIENFLRGRVMNPETGKYRKVYQPMMDEEGINLLLGDLTFHLHKGVFLSNLGKDDVNRKALHFRQMIAYWIYMRWHDFHIDRSNMDRIIENMDTIIFTSLMKPFNDMERRHLSEITSRSENLQIIQEPKRKRFGIF